MFAHKIIWSVSLGTCATWNKWSEQHQVGDTVIVAWLWIHVAPLILWTMFTVNMDYFHLLFLLLSFCGWCWQAMFMMALAVMMEWGSIFHVCLLTRSMEIPFHCICITYLYTDTHIIHIYIAVCIRPCSAHYRAHLRVGPFGLERS